MARGTKVFVGLSGGVDSAVSAALLKEQGHDVTGVFITIALPGYPCTAGVDRLDAMRVAAHLRIPFREIDLSAEYRQKVFEHSVREFEQGRTPNPDALCNREIKFGLFFDYAMREGADYIATGHYARMQDGQLYAGVDTEKDQSYFLALVPECALQKTLFPIGQLHKHEVRARAARYNLPNAARKDSQGLCFLGPVSIHEMLDRELAPQPGAVVDRDGRTVGTHSGAAHYTLGQRHGFVVQSPVPLYVVAKDSEANTITVSPEKFPQGAESTVLALEDANWIGAIADGTYTARYRYRQEGILAHKEGNAVVLKEPHYAPVGQVLVLYQHERCMGGGVIAKATIQ